MDHAAWLQEGLTDNAEPARERYRYYMRNDPEMRDLLGPIETVDDPITQRQMRRRLGKVGTTRGARPEFMKEHWIYLDPLPHIRIDHGKPLQGWYQPKHNDKPGSRVRPCMTDAVLTQPYGGYCTVGCGFCYINSGFRGYRGSGLVTVPMGYGEQVRRSLRTMRTSAAGYFSSFTDPFLPLEDFYHNTRDGAQAFVEEGLPIFFLSRLPYPDWAFDLLLKNPHSYMQKSLNCPDEDDWRQLSPGAAPLEEHFQQIREAKRRGIYVSIQCNPIIAGIITHDDVKRLFDKLADCGADHVIVKFVEADHAWAKAMVERMTKRFGENRAAAFRDLFTCFSSGNQRTVDEEYRLEGHRLYREHATRLGMTYASCYEYRKLPNGQHISIGREVLTADQCHGHRVPMYTRRRENSPFEPVTECPPTGCLYCAKEDELKGQCGSEIFGAAGALKLSDLKKPVYGEPS